MKRLTLILIAGLLASCSGAATATAPAPSAPRPAATPSISAPALSPAATPQTRSTVTLADNGSTVSLKVGASFLLDLGEERTWEVAIGDLSIVSRVPNIEVIRGAQGVYTARSIGKTTLSAYGKVNCPQGQICPQNILAFRVNIVVE